MKNLTKLGFGHVKTFLRSFWAISIDMQNPYGNELWVEKHIFLTKMIVSAEYSTNVEISAWKYFFQKVWIMGYIFHISHAWKYSKPTELHYFKLTLQNTFFKGFYFKKLTVRVYGYDSRRLSMCSASQRYQNHVHTMRQSRNIAGKVRKTFKKVSSLGSTVRKMLTVYWHFTGVQ